MLCITKKAGKQSCDDIDKLYKEMKGKRSEVLLNDEIRRTCGMVDIAEKGGEANLLWHGHVIKRDERKLIKDIAG